MATLPYTTNIPLDTDIPAQSQPVLLQNTNSIPAIINVDHNNFDVDDDYGKHKKVTFPVQSAAPVPGVNELMLFNMIFNTSTNPTNIPEIFCARYKANPSSPLPPSQLYPITATDGTYAYLPSGMLMQWGSMAGNTDALTITFSQSFSNLIYYVYSAQTTAAVGPGPTYNFIASSVSATTATSITFSYINAIQRTGFGTLSDWRVTCIAIGTPITL